MLPSGIRHGRSETSGQESDQIEHSLCQQPRLRWTHPPTDGVRGSMEIHNSTAFVTGANRGLGRHLVGHLLQAGAAKVYAGARDIAALDAPWSADPRVQLIRLDVTDPASIDEAAAK